MVICDQGCRGRSDDQGDVRRVQGRQAHGRPAAPGNRYLDIVRNLAQEAARVVFGRLQTEDFYHEATREDRPREMAATGSALSEAKYQIPTQQCHAGAARNTVVPPGDASAGLSITRQMVDHRDLTVGPRIMQKSNASKEKLAIGELLIEAVQLLGRVANQHAGYAGSGADAPSALEAFLNRPLKETALQRFAPAFAKKGAATIRDLARFGKVQLTTIGLTEREILTIERLNFHLHGQRPGDIRPQR